MKKRPRDPASRPSLPSDLIDAEWAIVEHHDPCVCGILLPM